MPGARPAIDGVAVIVAGAVPERGGDAQPRRRLRRREAERPAAGVRDVGASGPPGSRRPACAVNAIDVRDTASAGDGGGEPPQVTGLVMSVPISRRA